VAIATWVNFWDSPLISYSFLNSTRQVPWFFQGLRLGVIGIFGSIYLIFIVAKKKYRKDYNFLLLFSIYSFFIGRVVTFANIFLLYSADFYWEERFEYFIILPWIIFAVEFSLKIFDKLRNFDKLTEINRKKNRFLKQISKYGVISVIFFSCFTTVLLNLEVRYESSQPLNQMANEDEWNDTILGLEKLSEIIKKDPNTSIITLSQKTKNFINLAGVLRIYTIPEDVAKSTNPNHILQHLFLSHFWRDEFSYQNSYVYLPNSDFLFIRQYPKSTLYNLLTLIPVIYENPEIKIYNCSLLSFPNSKGVSIQRIAHQDSKNDVGNNIVSNLLSIYKANYIQTDTDVDLDGYDTMLLSYDPIEPLDDLKPQLLSFYDSNIEGYWIRESATEIDTERANPFPYVSNMTFIDNFLNFNLSLDININNIHENSTVYVGFKYNIPNIDNISKFSLGFHPNGTVSWQIQKNVNFSPRYSMDWLNWSQNKRFLLNINWKNQVINFTMGNSSSLFQENITNDEIKIGIDYLIEHRYGYLSMRLVERDIISYNTNEFINISDYIDFASSGKNLVVFNSNGYHSLTGQFLKTQPTSTNISTINFANKKINLTHNITVPISTLNESTADLKIIANFTNFQGVEIPFIIQKKIGNGNIYCVNIFPMLDDLTMNESLFENIEDIQHLLSFTDLKVTNASYLYEIINSDGYIHDDTSTAFLDGFTLLPENLRGKYFNEGLSLPFALKNVILFLPPIIIIYVILYREPIRTMSQKFKDKRIKRINDQTKKKIRI
jgi:hypothetical protein